MPLDRIVHYPDRVLRTATKNCVLVQKEIMGVVKQLHDVMKNEAHGIGIAAPQIGLSHRIAIIDVSAREPSAKKMVLVNPIIHEMRDMEIGREGCMSVPDYTALVKRYRWIRFSYHDEFGKPHEKISEGIEAICVQHEIDHLDGKLLIDRVHCLKTDLLPRRMTKP